MAPGKDVGDWEWVGRGSTLTLSTVLSNGTLLHCDAVAKHSLQRQQKLRAGTSVHRAGTWRNGRRGTFTRADVPRWQSLLGE